jgi:hypothetical protein
MCLHHRYRRAIAAALIAFSAPLSADAQSLDVDQRSSIPVPGNSISPFPTIGDVLSREPFRPFWNGSEHSLNDRAAPLSRESIELQLRQRLQSRLQHLPPRLSRAAGNAAAVSDVVDLEHQRSSWLAIVAGDHQVAAAHLHEALLRGRPATLAELHRLAGGEQAYEAAVGSLNDRRELKEAGQAKQFLLIYHSAIRGDRSLASAALALFDQQLPPIDLDPIVRLRLLQLLGDRPD